MSARTAERTATMPEIDTTHHHHAEQAALASMLLANACIDDVALIVQPEQFHGEAHQTICRAVFDLFHTGNPADAVTLAAELHSRGQLEEIGGPGYLHEMMEAVPHAGNAEHYAGIVRTAWRRRQVIYATGRAARQAGDPSTDPEEVIAAAEADLQAILQSETSGTRSIRELLTDCWGSIDNPEAVRTTPTGFADLDRLSGGMRGGHLIVLGARPSMGKTSLAGNIAANVSGSGGPVVMFSLEQPRLELTERLLCSEARVPSNLIKSGNLSDPDRHALLQASTRLGDRPLYIDDEPDTTVARIGAVCRRQKRRGGLSLIVIDYAQLIRPADSRAPREQQVAGITRELKILAKRLDVPVMVLAQLNRQVDSRPDHAPVLSDLRESGAVEQDADQVWFLWRPSYYQDDHPDKSLAKVSVAKNRGGETGRLDLNWRPELTTFQNRTEGEPSEAEQEVMW